MSSLIEERPFLVIYCRLIIRTNSLLPAVIVWLCLSQSQSRQRHITTQFPSDEEMELGKHQDSKVLSCTGASICCSGFTGGRHTEEKGQRGRDRRRWDVQLLHPSGHRLDPFALRSPMGLHEITRRLALFKWISEGGFEGQLIFCKCVHNGAFLLVAHQNTLELASSLRSLWAQFACLCRNRNVDEMCAIT
nr:PREDICTED: uncharacterized protein LOC108951571 [Musa acuminata subsp. malaccensis]